MDIPSDIGKDHADEMSTNIGVPHQHAASERSMWVLNAPARPTTWSVVHGTVRKLAQKLSCKSAAGVGDKQAHFVSCIISFLQSAFPILQWLPSYTVKKFKNDVLAGLALASISIPQSIGYATLAKLDPQYGLYTSIVPPIIYALMGSSKEIAIGPVAVASLLLSSMIQELEDPVANPVAYRKLVLSTTLLAGIFQAAFGLCRLGFLVDFLSHATIVGFTAGAAIVIGLQQLKGLLGVSYFTTKTDVVSVLGSVWRSFHHSWKPHDFFIGCSFFIFILTLRFLGRKYKKFFWLPAIAPIASVILSTLIVYLTRADKHGTDIVKHIHGGLNPSSANQLQLDSKHFAQIVKSALTVAVVSLTEAIAVGRSFASLKGYHIDGNKEMVAIGFTNIVGSLSSCYVATGSFSRTAVNANSGCETAMSNIVMAVTVLIALQFFTRLLYYTPTAILASIILSALPGLIDFKEALNIWRIDKLDFLACLGAFLGVLFGSVEIGLLVGVIISFVKIVLGSIHPGIEIVGQITGTDVFCDVLQYPMAVAVPEVLTVRVKSSSLCFANANSIRGRITREADRRDDVKGKTRVVILDLSCLTNIDTTGITSLEELQRELRSGGKQLLIANPRWEVIHKLKAAKFDEKIGGKVFLTVTEAVESCMARMLI